MEVDDGGSPIGGAGPESSRIMTAHPKTKSQLSREELRATLLEAGREILHRGRARNRFQQSHLQTSLRAGGAEIGEAADQRLGHSAGMAEPSRVPGGCAGLHRPGREPPRNRPDRSAPSLRFSTISTCPPLNRGPVPCASCAGLPGRQVPTPSPVRRIGNCGSAWWPWPRRPILRIKEHRVQAALMEGYEAVTKFWDETYGPLMELFGVRIRQPWTHAPFHPRSHCIQRGVFLADPDRGEYRDRSFGRPDPTARIRSGRSSQSGWKHWCINSSSRTPNSSDHPRKRTSTALVFENHQILASSLRRGIFFTGERIFSRPPEYRCVSKPANVPGSESRGTHLVRPTNPS